ncbi:hypothetical protein ABZX99_28990 [Streptomyces antibioticus]|uniref:hypothetical protein n=1 Tax=Streptomyces antibioticus TaxID=1890 RepID=UPI0033A765DF
MAHSSYSYALARDIEGEIVGFWYYQRRSFRVLRAKIRARWSRRVKIGLLAAMATIITVGFLVAPAISDYRHRNDIAIEKIKDGDSVDRCIPSIVGRGKLDNGHGLWIAVGFLVKDTGRARDRDRERILFSKRAEQSSDDEWYASKIDVGGEGQTDSPYTLYAVDVDPALDRALLSSSVELSPYDDPAPPSKDNWRISFDSLPSGAHEVDRKVVTRKAGDDPNCNAKVEASRKKQ